MKYQLYRKQHKPIVLNKMYPWEKVTDEQVIESFGTDKGVIPQRFAATIFKNQQKGIFYSTLAWHWKAEEIKCP